MNESLINAQSSSVEVFTGIYADDDDADHDDTLKYIWYKIGISDKISSMIY